MKGLVKQKTLTGGEFLEIDTKIPYTKSLHSAVYRHTQARARKVSYISSRVW